MAKRKMSKADRLAALRDKIAQQDMGTSGFMRLEQGLNQVRILPEVGDMGFFFQAVGTHYIDDKRRVYCPRFTSEGELDCPICELVDELYQAGDAASRALAKKLRVRRHFWMNVINRANEDAGPLILTAGTTIFSPISSLINDPEYGFVMEIDDGTDVKIKRAGQGLETKYEVIAARRESPLSEDPELVEEWLSAAKDLSYVELSDDPAEDAELKGDHAVWVLPYERLVREYKLDDTLDDAKEDAEEDEPHRRKSGKRVVAEEELYDDEAPASEAQIEVRRRRVARRKRK